MYKHHIDLSSDTTQHMVILNTPPKKVISPSESTAVSANEAYKTFKKHT